MDKSNLIVVVFGIIICGMSCRASSDSQKVMSQAECEQFVAHQPMDQLTVAIPFPRSGNDVVWKIKSCEGRTDKVRRMLAFMSDYRHAATGTLNSCDIVVTFQSGKAPCELKLAIMTGEYLVELQGAIYASNRSTKQDSVIHDAIAKIWGSEGAEYVTKKMADRLVDE